MATPCILPAVTQEEEEAQQRQVVARAKSASQALRSDPPPESPIEDDVPSSNKDQNVREGVAASTEIGILVLQKLGRMERAIQALEEFRQDQQSAEQSLLQLMIKERESQLGLDEEITRTNLDLRKARAKRWGDILTRIVAVLATPPALVALYNWLSKFFQ